MELETLRLSAIGCNKNESNMMLELFRDKNEYLDRGKLDSVPLNSRERVAKAIAQKTIGHFNFDIDLADEGDTAKVHVWMQENKWEVYIDKVPATVKPQWVVTGLMAFMDTQEEIEERARRLYDIAVDKIERYFETYLARSSLGTRTSES